MSKQHGYPSQQECKASQLLKLDINFGIGTGVWESIYILFPSNQKKKSKTPKKQNTTHPMNSNGNHHISWARPLRWKLVPKKSRCLGLRRPSPPPWIDWVLWSQNHSWALLQSFCRDYFSYKSHKPRDWRVIISMSSFNNKLLTFQLKVVGWASFEI